jgi:acyl-coenzyme A synthetase/AMP-(fatty) acid ligase
VPGSEFYNLYGPTETNVVSWYRVPRDFDFSRPIPIGSACPYAELILDPAEEQKTDPITPRHLLAAGASVMLGYWNKPEETEKAFVALPDCQGVLRQFYRTGDRVLQNEGTGDYIFVGRNDRQVKRRGYRIELGEIEAALGRHPQVLEVAIASTQDSMNQTVISAFVRLSPDAPISQVELRVHCAQSLPSYMIPDKIIPLPSIPKGTRGKVDYAELSELVRRS